MQGLRVVLRACANLKCLLWPIYMHCFFKYLPCFIIMYYNYFVSLINWPHYCKCYFSVVRFFVLSSILSGSSLGSPALLMSLFTFIFKEKLQNFQKPVE